MHDQAAHGQARTDLGHVEILRGDADVAIDDIEKRVARRFRQADEIGEATEHAIHRRRRADDHGLVGEALPVQCDQGSGAAHRMADHRLDAA